jgi:hypothetical protein
MYAKSKELVVKAKGLFNYTSMPHVSASILWNNQVLSFILTQVTPKKSFVFRFLLLSYVEISSFSKTQFC